MKKILIFVLMMLAFQASAQLSGKDRFQAEQWVRAIRDLYVVGDYPTLRDYCLKVMQYYPETDYAVVAQEFLKKTDQPKKNRRREKIRNDPALTLGGW